MFTFLMFWKLFYSIFQTAGSGRSLCSYPEWLRVPFAKDRYKSLCFILIVPLTPAVSENHLIDSPEEWDLSFIHIRKNYSCSCSEVSYTPAGEDPRGKYFDRVKKVLFIIHLIYSDLLKVVSRAVVLASGYWIKDFIHFSCFLFFFVVDQWKNPSDRNQLQLLIAKVGFERMDGEGNTFNPFCKDSQICILHYWGFDYYC